MSELHPILQAALLALGPAGAGYVGVRVALNGLRENVRETRKDMGEVKRDLSDVRERVARIEGAHDRARR